MVMASGQFARLLVGDLTKVYSDRHKEYDSGLREMLYRIDDSDKAFEQYFEVGSLPDVQRWNGSVAYADVDPGYYTRIEPGEHGLGVIFEKKLIDDDQYGIFNNRKEMLAGSAARTRDKLAYGLFRNAFSFPGEFMQSEEGKPLCSTTHLTKSSSVNTSSGFSNSGSSALSKTSIFATKILMDRFKNSIGELINVEGDELFVPSALAQAAYEATGYNPDNDARSDMDPDSANRKINVSYGFKVNVLKRMDADSSTNWFMVASNLKKQCFHWINRKSPEFRAFEDQETFAYKASVYYREGYGFTDWRPIYGHQV